MPQEVDLAIRPDVELIKTGNWQAMSGTWSPTSEDLSAAVEAQNCPAIAKPIIKLGHVDSRFDGEPAFGYFENLRLADGGNTLVADQVTLPWLHSVQAAAYPSRSVEGNYRHRCSEGHLHRFVLTAVALLGITPPAVKTIRNLNDLPAALGVAAGEPAVPEGAEHVQVTILAGRHSAVEFDEAKHPRGHDGKFAHEAGAGLNALKDVSAGRPNGLKRDEKLAKRIPLGPGETYAGSGRVPDAGILAARVDTPNGPTLRIGVGIHAENISRWSGADKGATTVLDERGMDDLRTAIPHMLDAGKQGTAQWKTLNKQADKLDAAERDIVNRQYPQLTASGKKELAQIDRRLHANTGRLQQLEQRQQERFGRMPDTVRTKLEDLERQIGVATDAGDTAKVKQLRAEQEATVKGLDPANFGMTAALMRRDGTETDKLAAETADLNARRAELTKVSVPLSAGDKADLEKVRADIVDHNNQMVDFGDGAVLASGSIPGDWGSVDWTVSMSTDTPRYDIKVTPKRGTPPADIQPLEVGDLRKLAGLLDKAGANTPDVKAAGPAPDGDGDDDDEPTGVMVALIPTAEDAARLKVDGGEPAEQLHLTLAYLGDAADLDDSARQDLIDTVSSVVNGMPVIDGVIFSAAVYNPGDTNDRDTCLVYQVSGELLGDLQDTLDDALGDPDFSPEPWFAHVTAIYSDDLSRLADLTVNVGPVTFDRVRIAIAGQTVDIPLLDDADGPDPEDFAEGSIEVPNILMPVAAASADKLREYWVHGKGAAKIKWGVKNDFYRCVSQLRKYVADPKGLCNTYHREALGVAPGQEDVHAAHRKEAVMAAAVSTKTWDPQQSDYSPAQWKTACVIDTEVGSPDAKSRYKLPVREPDGTLNKAGVIAAGKAFDAVKSIAPATRKTAAGSLLALFKQVGVDPPPALRFAAGTNVAASGDPELPAAEPEQPNTDPKEDPVSTELSGLRSRLGLEDTADLDAITAAVDALKTKADTPAAPTPEMVAASAAATETAAKAVAAQELMKEEIARMSGELAEIKASAATTVKASFFQGLKGNGQLKPADEETWSARYDRDPEMVTEILSARAHNSEVPVMASGSIGSPEPDGTDTEFEALIARIDAPTGKAV